MLSGIRQRAANAAGHVVESGIIAIIKRIAKTIANAFVGDASEQIKTDAHKLAEDYVDQLATFFKEGRTVAAQADTFQPAVNLVTREVPKVAGLVQRAVKLRQDHVADMAAHEEAPRVRRARA